MVLKTKANYKALKLCKLTPFDMVLPTKITVEPKYKVKINKEKNFKLPAGILHGGQ
jgi:hypothetical protein